MLAAGSLAGMLLAAHAAPLNTHHLPPETAWCFHIDMEAFRKTELGRFLTDEAKDEQLAEAVRDFRRQCSFHPLQDVVGITLYGVDYAPGNGVLLLEGNLDSDAVVTSLRKDRHLRQSRHDGHILYQWETPDQRVSRVACFYQPTRTIVASHPKAVHRAIEVLDGKATSPPKVALPGPGEGVFLCGWATDCHGKMDGWRQSVLLSPVTRIAVAFEQTGTRVTGELHLETATQEEAAHLRDIAAGVLTLMMLNDEKNPIAARLASKTQVLQKDRVVQLRLQCLATTVRDALVPPVETSPANPLPTGLLPQPASGGSSAHHGEPGPAGPPAAPRTDSP
jgi:hypothetical protein